MIQLRFGFSLVRRGQYSLWASFLRRTRMTAREVWVRLVSYARSAPGSSPLQRPERPRALKVLADASGLCCAHHTRTSKMWVWWAGRTSGMISPWSCKLNSHFFTGTPLLSLWCQYRCLLRCASYEGRDPSSEPPKHRPWQTSPSIHFPGGFKLPAFTAFLIRRHQNRCCLRATPQIADYLACLTCLGMPLPLAHKHLRRLFTPLQKGEKRAV